MTTVAVFGLGYVGCVTAACLAKDGHPVVGVDVDADKVAEINAGQAPLRENGLGELIAEQVAAGHLKATTDTARAVAESSIAMIAVGTPSMDDGSVTTHALETVISSIGQALRQAPKPYHIVVRSTLLPGLLETQMQDALDAALGPDFPEDVVLCNNPEFLREGSALKDYYNPPYVLVGAATQAQAQPVLDLYEAVEGKRFHTDSRTAALVKYACNAFHAVKVTFANEIGAVAKAMGADGHEVMKLVCEDTKLNVSPAYMRPGFAFGGSCLPKDVRALTYKAGQLDIEHPLLGSLMRSNRVQIRKAFDLIANRGKRKIALLGLSFKAGSDDLRESPFVELAEMLIGKGYELRIFDSNVEYAKVVGANKEYIESKIPHVSSLLHSDLSQVVADADVVVLGHNDARFTDAVLKAGGDKQVIDLVGALPEYRRDIQEGICW